MKNSDKKIISRGIDSELSVNDRVHLDVLISTEPEAGKTARVWEAIGDHLRSEASLVSVPDPAVAWQDIRREIRQQEGTTKESPAASLGRLGWASVVASALVVSMLGVWAWMLIRTPASMMANHPAAATRVEWVKAEIPGATTMIYTDTETDLTVIWMDVAQQGEPHDS
jgi:anti-sigma factor RsiW